MKKLDNIILLDLDGVLITGAPWKEGERHVDDGWDVFDKGSVGKLNRILEKTGYDIVLSSARRTRTNRLIMNGYFRTRGVNKLIIDYVPDYTRQYNVTHNRREEIERFLSEHQPENYLIIDDDTSLHGASEEIKNNWIETNMITGLNSYMIDW